MEKKEKIKEVKGQANELCLWKDDCGDCNLDEKIFCTPKPKYAIYFISPFFIMIIPMVIEVIFFSDFNLLLSLIFFGGWLVYGFFFLNVWESRMLCNHCPYYANDAERTLHCPIDRGKLKTGKYDPGPSSKSEKLQFIIGASILMGFPVPFLIYGSLWVSLICLCIGIVAWIVILQTKICTDCVNFACPLNRVPKSIRNEFMNKNPIIKKTWEAKGYKFE